jgi:hypothetical protein
MFLIIALGFSACDTVYMATMDKMGYAKHDNILSSRAKSVRDAQEEAKKETQSALEQFGNVVSYQGGDLEATYKKLSGEDSAEKVRKRIKDVERGADVLFSEWETELDQYSSADLRRKSQAKLSQTKSRDKEMLGAMNQAEQRIDPVLKPFARPSALPQA